ncbi:MAG: hypothetical protein ABJ084_03365 [Halioglobus sp.]
MRTLFLAIAACASLMAAQAIADTLELTDGTLLEGEFMGSSNGIIMFNTGTRIEAFPEPEVAGIYLDEVDRSPKAAAAPAPAPAPKAKPSPPPPPKDITVPSGTRMVIRMADSIDTKRHKTGHRFRGQLEGAIVINSVTVAPRGTFVHGRIIQASTGGRAVGSSEMAIEFTDIMIDDQLYEIATTGLQAKTGNEAGKTAGRTARAAVIGGLISGKSGAKTGAAVGLGASILTSGSSINVPAGTILETTLRTPLTIPGNW